MNYRSKAETTGNLWPDELKILVIDDEKDILNLIRVSLESAGFRVIRTTKPEEGLKLAYCEKPDLVILDVMMPNLDGIELLRRIRRHPNLMYVPVIVVSARASCVEQLRMLQIGFDSDSEIDAFIGKPFSPRFLLKTVKQVLMKHRDFLLTKKRGQRGIVAKQPTPVR